MAVSEPDKRCSCGAGCATWGQCMRGKRILHDGAGHIGADKEWYREINAYKDAYAQGIRPAGTKWNQINAAVRASNETGTAFDAGAT